MTEDHAVPAADWVRQILAAHEQPFAVIGGAIENAVDRPLNRALYYCDFGRYGRPLERGEAAYVSDVNVSYKREALMAVQDVWRDSYHETTTHWTLRARGEVLYLDPRLVVYQQRPPISWVDALRERIEWGRIFAETRAARLSTRRRLLYAAGAPLLPAVLSARVWGHMRRQRLGAWRLFSTLLPAIVLLTGWVLGELAGYVSGPPRGAHDGSRIQERAVAS
jgi:hypothetical protein